MKQLAKYSNIAYALLRIITGCLFALHGAEKVLGFLADHPQPPVGSFVWIGGVIELVGGLLVMAGFLTRFAAFICCGEMAVAYFQFHWKFQMGANFFPSVNKGEMAVLYCFIFLVIACKGAVTWGIDKD